MNITNKVKIAWLLAGMLGGYQIQAAPLKEPTSNPRQGTWIQTLEGRDINKDGIMDAYFDATQNITWWAQMNVGSWNEAQKISEKTWGGVTGWRLPHTGLSEENNEVAVLRNEVLGNGKKWSNQGPFELTFDQMKSHAIWEDWSWSINQKNTWASAWNWDKNQLVINKINPNQNKGWIWGVHDGDVLAPVPEPETWALGLAGLVAVFGLRKKTHK